VKNNPSIQGVYTALGSPFLVDGSIDWKAFEGLLHHQAQGGVDGIVISGTTGESPTLTVQEKLAMIKKAKAILPGNIKVMAGTGGNNTEQSVELSRLAEDAGADSLLIVTPPYNKPSIAGIRAHLEAIGSQVKIPLCLYHVPGRTGQLLNASQLNELCQVPHVKAVKEASGDIALFSRGVMGSTASYLSGDDATYLPSLSVGGQGVISVITNIYPAEFVQMTRCFQAGDLLKARRIHEVLMAAMDIMFCESNPGPLKAALAIKGMAMNNLRLPLVSVSAENYQKIKTILEATDGKIKALA